MASRYPSSVILILLSIIMLLSGIGYVPSFPVVPAAHASAAGNPAILGMWNNTRKSNADFDTLVIAGKTFTIDVNVTGAPGLIQAVIGLNWTGSASPGLSVTKVSWDSTNGLTGGIFDCASRGCGDTALQSITGTTFINYQLQDNAQTPPGAAGTGQIMRVQFSVLTTGSYTIHLNTCAKGTSCQSSGGPLGSDSHGGSGSILYASSPIAYQTIDGYFSDVAGSDNFSVSTNQPIVAVLRTVSGTNLTLPVATISVTLIAGPAHLTTLTVLGLPRGATSVQSGASCTPSPSPCTITLQIQVTGGLASALTTTPQGTYGLVVAGNATGVGGPLMKYSPLTLVVKPPKPPTFGVSANVDNFLLDTGSSIQINTKTFLTCGSCPNENVTFTSNFDVKTGGTYSFSPSLGKGFPFSSVMTATIPSDSFGPFGVIRFNVTATTVPIYSEVQQKANLTLTVDVVQDFAPLVVGKSVAYTNPSLASNPISVLVSVNNTGTTTLTSIAVNATAKVQLRSDSQIMFVNTTNTKTERWTAAKAVVYDSNGDGRWQTGEPVILGPAPTNNKPLKFDSFIMFSDLHYSGVWTGKTTALPTGDPVTYQTDGDGLYDKAETMINGTINAGVLIGSTTIASLAPGASATVSFAWNPVALLQGKYLLVGYSGTGVSAAIRGTSQFTQKLRGDINGDCTVDVSDVTNVGNVNGASPTLTVPPANLPWFPNGSNADQNNDQTIDISDIVLVASSQGLSC